MTGIVLGLLLLVAKLAALRMLSGLPTHCQSTTKAA
jgi:hypothetical protein